MAKIDDLKKGDRVSWDTSQGRTRGKVVGIRTKPFSIKGTDLTASKDKPMVEVESEKTGAHASHKASALSKLQAAAGTATGKKATGKASKGTKADSDTASSKKADAKASTKRADAKASLSKKADSKKATKTADTKKATTKKKANST